MKADQKFMRKTFRKKVSGRRKEFCEKWEMSMSTLEKLATGYNPISPEKFACWMLFTGKDDLTNFVNGQGMNREGGDCDGSL